MTDMTVSEREQQIRSRANEYGRWILQMLTDESVPLARRLDRERFIAAELDPKMRAAGYRAEAGPIGHIDWPPRHRDGDAYSADPRY